LEQIGSGKDHRKNSIVKWHHIPGKAVDIGCGSGKFHSVWVCNMIDDVYRLKEDHQSWEKMDGKVTAIACGHPDNVWGCSKDQYIYQWGCHHN